MGFSETDVPSLTDKTFVVTGANSGIGLEAADIFAAKGAHVIMACRSMDKGARAVERIRERGAEVSVELMSLDLADLSSVRSFVGAVAGKHPRVDVLVNNAGVMALPYGKTKDGFERQLGTNHFGHFALTARLFRALESPPARVVTVASHAHRWGRIRFDDLDGDRGYQRWLAYGQSKLANLLFMNELARRQPTVISAACHPGYSSTNLLFGGSGETGSSAAHGFWRLANGSFAQSARAGALPTVFAATHPDVRSQDYFGPSGLLELTGRPKRVRMTARAKDPEVARQLWQVSETRTGEAFP